MSYRVLIDDNYHFTDESERVTHGVFPTAQEAVSACQKIVDEWLASAFKPGMASEALWELYVAFGDDSFILPVEPKDAPAADFDAWDYARQRCEAMGGGALDV
ncbi:hypothetical protein [Bradyrhizobium sp. 62]|uniref:hypothetical protein n=1 Tax=Bradyrhizobium sp. 62 TaxID=1043588 RepID=UPI001FF8AD60|nr:hypothetical protein [Bradyrhizobium sp. 62]MCK1367236.1 hypothetical protein [Bradyrhizobium sp. 62]